MAKKSVSSHAVEGGNARARALTPEQRSEIARNAVEARWAKEGKNPIPRATHVGDLEFGDVAFECAVLDDGTRVISETKFMEAMGMYRSGALSTRRRDEKDGASIPLSLAHKNLKRYAEVHLGGVHYGPFRYRTKTGNLAHGIRAECLPKICEVWLDARNAGVLGSRQILVAEKAEIIIRALARVGIVALIDEATGYQYERQRNALEELLREVLSDSLRRWVKTFPDSYFRELCRLRNIPYPDNMRLPQYFGRLTNDIVYNRLAPRVLVELQERNPRSESGRRRDKHHQWLSENVGHPKLLQHLGMVVGLMKVSSDWNGFKELLNRAAPIYDENSLFRELEFPE